MSALTCEQTQLLVDVWELDRDNEEEWELLERHMPDLAETYKGLEGVSARGDTGA